MNPLEEQRARRASQRNSCSRPPARLVSVSNLADTLIPANDAALRRIIQVVGNASALRVVYGASTMDGLNALYTWLLNPASGVGLGGGSVIEDAYTGSIALRAMTAPVTVAITEV